MVNGKDPFASLRVMPERNRFAGYTQKVEKIYGHGSFGVVYLAIIQENNEKVAIKKVQQDKRQKNRELQIMNDLAHPQIINVRHAFQTTGERPDEIQLNIVMDFMPETLYRVLKVYARSKTQLPYFLVKLYMWQTCKALAQIHKQGICHRDIKPSNVLIEPALHVARLCDFGSAKKLIRGESNVS